MGRTRGWSSGATGAVHSAHHFKKIINILSPKEGSGRERAPPREASSEKHIYRIQLLGNLEKKYER